MTSHSFDFEGGEELSKMGSSWFVSYSYYDHKDKNHTNWTLVSTAEDRKRRYNNTVCYHKYWLEQVLDMNDNKP